MRGNYHLTTQTKRERERETRKNAKIKLLMMTKPSRRRRQRFHAQKLPTRFVLFCLQDKSRAAQVCPKPKIFLFFLIWTNYLSFSLLFVPRKKRENIHSYIFKNKNNKTKKEATREHERRICIYKDFLFLNEKLNLRKKKYK